MKLNNNKILIVDDEIAVAGLVGEIVREFGKEPIICTRGKKAIKAFLEEKPFMVISDLTMPEMTGVELLRELRQHSEEVSFVIMTGYGTIESAVEAIRLGADDYTQKPLNLDYIRHLIKKAGKTSALIQENRDLKEQISQADLPEIIGSSAKLESLMRTLKKAAGSEADIMLAGESGTGKEMLAHSIHRLSARKEKPFVAVDCVALPKALFESEMFGYEKGAFTGAEQQRDGLLMQANGGTLFIDEVTELDYDLQAKLLRVLQERQFRRVGGRDLIELDVRIVTATRRDPLEEVREKRFRDDLYYRLSVIPLKVPSLRERKSDIPILVHHFIKVAAGKNRSAVKLISPDVVTALEMYEWPGNIRELKNIIERMFVLSDEKITLADLPEQFSDFTSTPTPDNLWEEDSTYRVGKESVLEFFTKNYFSRALNRSKGNVSTAAGEAGLSRKAFYDLMRKYNIEK